MANTIFTQKSICLASGTFITRCESSKADYPTHHLPSNSKIKYNRFFTSDQSIFQNVCTRKMNMAVYANTPSGAPFPVDPSHGHWKVWILGTIVTILLSFSRGKWGPLLQLKDKIGATIDEAERVADIVEEVAERVEKAAEEAAEKLPEGKFQDAAEFIGKVAEDIDKHAENVEDALEKVEDMEKKLESFIESTTHEEKTTVVTKSQDQK
ncbi:hypothetical protein TanjilG_32487 [Lupinus angustifolius]|uniref:Uncharacterized protein n=1 Tax=Lupinus angustifolius TaxID=3871 RepID=A0A4P1R7R0_LUPAN|nr:PREDICTED: uncharacterized protein LOC109356365 [Lupinus angustifolius]OIW04295.1 hypothetical protein TanjilG_32487 [Lupinus angustifolius]